MGDTDLVRPLGLAGVPCVLVADRADPTRRSRFVRDTLDPEGDLAARLCAYAAEQAEPPVLFYQRDSYALSVSRERERFSRAFRFVVPDAELVEDLVDKERFGALAARLELPVPAGCVVDPRSQGVGPMPLPAPVVVKPLTRSALWFGFAGWSKAVRIESEAAWRRMWPELARAGSRLVVQELIPGGEQQVVSYHVYVDARGEVAGEFTGRKLRTWPAEFGASTALVTTRDAAVRDLGREIVGRMGLRGVAKLDFKRTPDGSLRLLEVNPRFSLWAHPGAVAGVNLPALVHADLTGRPRPPASQARPGVRWRELRTDFSAARALQVPGWRWAGWALGTEARSGMALDDPMPILAGKVWPRLTGHRAPR